VPYIPHTQDDVNAMLDRIGVPAIDGLLDAITAALRAGSRPGVPDALTEMVVSRLAAERAAAGGGPRDFIGAGA
jgi:glycine dehydrogenase subunit 1